MSQIGGIPTNYYPSMVKNSSPDKDKILEINKNQVSDHKMPQSDASVTKPHINQPLAFEKKAASMTDGTQLANQSVSSNVVRVLMLDVNNGKLTQRTSDLTTGHVLSRFPQCATTPAAVAATYLGVSQLTVENVISDGQGDVVMAE